MRLSPINRPIPHIAGAADIPRMMSSNEEKLEHPKSNGRVKVNVGGTYFETTVSTLTRLDNTVLSTMVADRWQNQEELFVDRSPTYFGKVSCELTSSGNLTFIFSNTGLPERWREFCSPCRS